MKPTNLDDSLYFAEAYDFARCQRPDGSYYGTGGVCRKGTPVDAKEKKSKASMRERYKTGSELGEGAYGRVVETEEGSVIKVGRLGPDEIPIGRELGEAGIAPEIIQHEWTAMEPKDGGPRMGMVEMSKALGEPFIDQESSLSAKDLNRAGDEYVGAMKAMHTRGIAHNDFHEQNFFYDSATGRGTSVDFGLSSRRKDDVIAEATSNVTGLWSRGSWASRASGPRVTRYKSNVEAVNRELESKGFVTPSGRVKVEKISDKEYKSIISRIYEGV